MHAKQNTINTQISYLPRSNTKQKSNTKPNRIHTNSEKYNPIKYIPNSDQYKTPISQTQKIPIEEKKIQLPIEDEKIVNQN